MKRILLIALASLVASTALVTASQYPQIEYARSKYVEHQDFKRISEFFDDQENQGDKLIMRTDPKVRKGWYLILSLDDEADEYPEGTRIGIKYIHPNVKGEIVKATSLPTPIKDSSEIWIGLTGDEAPDKDNPIVAWMVVIYSPDGKVYTHHKSYLWEKPETKEGEDE